MGFAEGGGAVSVGLEKREISMDAAGRFMAAFWTVLMGKLGDARTRNQSDREESPA